MPAGGPPPPRPRRRIPGLREQVTTTIASAKSLGQAHLDLAKAEMAVIGADLGQVLAQIGVAVALLVYLLLLVSVGGALFLGEWIFGSMGWGILHGALFCVATAVALVLGALRIPRGYLAGRLLLALLLGVVVGTVLGLAWPHQAYGALGEQLMPALEPAWRPLFVGLTVFGAIFAFLGLLLGARAGGVGGALGGFLGGAVVGALFGAFTAIDFSLQVGIAIGVTVTLATWPALAALALRGYDWDELQRRFTPQASIDAAMATKAFIEARLPGGKEDGA